MNLSVEHQERLLYDYEFFALNVLKIRDYSTGLPVPFKFNAAQKIIHRATLEDTAAGKPIRHLVLKARKEGATTYYDGRGYWLSSTRPFSDGMVAAHTTDDTIRLFNAIRTFYDESPEWAQPMRSASTRREIRFENPTQDVNLKRENPGLRSSINVGTAGSEELQRGGTPRWFHGSETAFWPNDGHQQMLGVMNAFPEGDKDTMVVLESTANGPSGYFYDQVMKAHKDPESSAYRLIFLPWTVFEKYRVPVVGMFDLRDDVEEELRAKGVTDEQLNWRRRCIIERCDGSEDYFRQEYPFTVEEAFLYTGSSVFDKKRIMVFLSGSKEGRRFSVDNDKVVPDDAGRVLIYEDPEPGVTYVAGADTSEGIEDEKKDTDWSWFSIWRRGDMKQVLSYRVKLDPDIYAKHIVALGRMYDWPWMNPELNNHGLVVTNYLRDHYPHGKLYTTKKVDRLDDHDTDIVGFKTTKGTKPLLVSKTVEIIREGECWVSDPVLCGELLAYYKTATGSYEGRGSHDDGVISMCLAVWARDYSYEMSKKKDEDPYGFMKDIRRHDPAVVYRSFQKTRPKEFILGSHNRTDG